MSVGSVWTCFLAITNQSFVVKLGWYSKLLNVSFFRLVLMSIDDWMSLQAFVLYIFFPFLYSYFSLYFPKRDCRGFLVDWFSFGSCFISFILRMVLAFICLSVFFFFLQIWIALSWLVYWKHSNICGFGVGQEDEEYHGLSKGETSHIIVWQVHC